MDTRLGQGLGWTTLSNGVQEEGVRGACRRNMSGGKVRLISLEHSILFPKTRDLFQKM